MSIPAHSSICGRSLPVHCYGDIRDVVESSGQTAVTRSDGGRVATPDLTLVNTADGIALDRPEPVLTVRLHDRNRTGGLRRVLERLSF